MTGSSTGKIANLIANTNTAVGSSACLQFGTWSTSGSGTGTSSPAAEIAGVCMNATFGRTDLIFSTYNETNSLTEKMRINAVGYVGVGTTNPQFPLHVYSSSSDQGYSGWYGFNLGANGATIRTGVTNNPTSIYANGSIVSRNSVLSVTNTFTSDNRIKKNIRLIDSEKALEMLTHITPKIYNFIDEFTLGNRDKYGLIAQEVEEIFPESIGYTTEYIPNIFDVVDISTDGYTLTLKKVSTSLFNANTDGSPIKIKLIDKSNHETFKTITEIIDDKSFTINEPIKSEVMFIFGQQIDNFRTIEYPMLNVITMSALQEVNKKLEAATSKIEDLTEINNKLQDQINSLSSRVNNAGL
jgi:hypothetical protein